MASGRPTSQRSDRSIAAAPKPAAGSVCPKNASSKRSGRGSADDDEDSCRVRVALRLRPKNADDLLHDSDFAECVSMQPELKRVKLKKNFWSSDHFRFDEVFMETASQKRVYEAVAKPIVESVLSGYNGIVMAYGQTGTGKTYTVGRLGKDDPSERGIMVRAMEDILSEISPGEDTVAVSYLQLYLEWVQDLLAPEKSNIPIVDDQKTGEVSLPGCVTAEVRNLEQFMELLQIGEVNRRAANTKLNTESSRSHAILMVYVQRSSKVKDKNLASQEKISLNGALSSQNLPVVLKSKLLVVDLAGSERVDKSGSEGVQLEEAKFINLSLTSLGKCINALAENSPHIPIRDSKLTRLLRDSFGGTARTSLIVTIGPSARNYSETASTIAFGQRAMKVVNTVKLKVEVDYEGRCKKLESQVDYLTSEMDRQQKNMNEEKLSVEKKLEDCKSSLAEAETQVDFLSSEMERLLKLKDDEIEQMNVKLEHCERLLAETEAEFSLKSESLEIERSQLDLKVKKLNDELSFQKKRVLLDLDITKLMDELSTQKKETIRLELVNQKLIEELDNEKEEIKRMVEELDNEKGQSHPMCEKIIRLEMDLTKKKVEDSEFQKLLEDTTHMYENKVVKLVKQVEDEHLLCARLNEELATTRHELSESKISLETLQSEMEKLNMKLLDMSRANEEAAGEIEALNVAKDELLSGKELLSEELKGLQKRLSDEDSERKVLEKELGKIKNASLKICIENESVASAKSDSAVKDASALGFSASIKSSKTKETLSGQKATISKIFEEVGLPNILALLKSEDLDVQIHAVKVVANLAAEDLNQQRIVDEGGLDALLMLLESSRDATIQRVAAGAIANLAMNGVNQGIIMSKGSARLLANISSSTDDPQTLRMIAGAIANLCGNEKLHVLLKEDGGTKALLRMVKSGNNDVIAQVARGIANFAKCESRGITQGQKRGKSLLVEDGAIDWMVANYTAFPPPIRRHIELALCHLAQNEHNSQDIIRAGGVKELVRISQEASREDVCNLAKKALSSNPAFLKEMHK